MTSTNGRTYGAHPADAGAAPGPAAAAGCDRIMPQRPDLSAAELDRVEQVYAQHGLRAEFRYSGNVLELVVQQPPDQLRRGGPLWARVGPYIYLFSPGTRQLFADHPGLAGVRAITMAGDTEVARALLEREALTTTRGGARWRC
jgi:hypothetical protein